MQEIVNKCKRLSINARDCKQMQDIVKNAIDFERMQ